jgi:Flp pilus assembly CpaF family ATPase
MTSNRPFHARCHWTAPTFRAGCPLVERPAFNIRKPASQVFTLDEYAAEGVATQAHADYLRGAILARKNIIVAGGTGSG